jgi:hypothetical protein
MNRSHLESIAISALFRFAHFWKVRWRRWLPSGTIAVRSGIPHHQTLWGWRCGFYPGSEPDEFLSGTAATFGQARRLRELMAALKRSN